MSDLYNADILLWAVVRMPSEIDGVAPLPTPADCPYELEELLREI